MTTIKKRARQQIPQCTANCERDNHKPKVESLVLKPMTVNPDLILDLITVSDFSRSVILMSRSGIFWSCGLSSPSPHPHEQSPLPETILSFLLLTTFLFHPVSAYKSTHTVQLLGAPLYLGCRSIYESLTKANETTRLNFCSLTKPKVPSQGNKEPKSGSEEKNGFQT